MIWYKIFIRTNGRSNDDFHTQNGMNNAPGSSRDLNVTTFEKKLTGSDRDDWFKTFSKGCLT